MLPQFPHVTVMTIPFYIVAFIVCIITTVQVSLDWKYVPARAPLLSKPCKVVCGCHVTLGTGQSPSTLGMPFSTGAMAG